MARAGLPIQRAVVLVNWAIPGCATANFVVSGSNDPGLGPVAEIDWASWQPDDVATLLFVLEEKRVLLIRKKRGLGAGKINAPGGRLEPGETPLQAAIREVQEEVGITPLRPESRGVLSFEFTNGYKLRAHLFVARAFEGTLCETQEATPLWFSLAEVPYTEMWADDRLWLPHLLAGASVEGHFVFDGDRMLGERLRIIAAVASSSSAPSSA
jgi:8-oxo-dGTP diphosphatase